MRALVAFGAFAVVMLLAARALTRQTERSLITIDVFLEPDVLMIEAAKAAGGRLRRGEGAGDTRGAAAAPHLTLVRRTVRVRDLDAIGAAVAKALRVAPALPLTLTAVSYGSTQQDGVGVLGYDVERSPALVDLEVKLAQALQPFAVGGAAAEARQPFSPHVTIGAARADVVESIKAEPFKRFTFSGVGVGIDQLAAAGTAQKKLWSSRP